MPRINCAPVRLMRAHGGNAGAELWSCATNLCKFAPRPSLRALKVAGVVDEVHHRILHLLHLGLGALCQTSLRTQLTPLTCHFGIEIRGADETRLRYQSLHTFSEVVPADQGRRCQEASTANKCRGKASMP